MSKTAARARDARATRGTILEAAEGVFVERGFADAAMSEIARRAGVTKSLLHHHFGSKEGLWGAVKERRFRMYADEQQRMLEESGATEGLLRESVKTYFHFLAANPGFVRFMAWVQLEEPEGSWEPAEELTRLGTEKIRQAQEAGQLRDDVDPFFVLVSFLSLVEHWFQAKRHRCSGFAEDADAWDDERYLEDMLKIFFGGLAPRSEVTG